MEKKRFDQYQNDSLGSLEGLNRNADKEVLEISSTGYGLESVSKGNAEENESQENKKIDSFSEGV